MFETSGERLLVFTGYPVDGLLQVEEEEEEAVAADDDDSDSDGRDTYTVENERFPRDAADGKRNVGGAPLLNQHGPCFLPLVPHPASNCGVWCSVELGA